jgi:hypothetical protein
VTEVRGSHSPSFLRPALIVVVAVVLTLLAENLLVPAYLARQPRLTTDFSAAYLDRKLASMAANPPHVVFLGDSAIWGYSLPPQETALYILQQKGCDCINLAFKAGSPANYYALARLFARYGVHPHLVVLELNQRSLNPADQTYKSLHPAIAALANPLFTPQDRTLLDQPVPALGIGAMLDRLTASLWRVYSMRADLRALINGDVDALPKQKGTADQFLGTYDLTPLDEKNIGVTYLEKTVELLNEQHIPVVAYLTPTNHALLHEYIDDPAYAANGDYLKRVLQKRGVRVVDLDRAFPTDEFIDNAHLTPAGQQRLAGVLSRDVLPSPLP